MNVIPYLSRRIQPPPLAPFARVEHFERPEVCKSVIRDLVCRVRRPTNTSVPGRLTGNIRLLTLRTLPYSGMLVLVGLFYLCTRSLLTLTRAIDRRSWAPHS